MSRKNTPFQYVRPSTTWVDVALAAAKFIFGYLFAIVVTYSLLILFGN